MQDLSELQTRLPKARIGSRLSELLRRLAVAAKGAKEATVPQTPFSRLRSDREGAIQDGPRRRLISETPQEAVHLGVSRKVPGRDGEKLVERSESLLLVALSFLEAC